MLKFIAISRMSFAAFFPLWQGSYPGQSMWDLWCKTHGPKAGSARVLRCYPLIISLVLHTYLLIYHWHYRKFANGSVVKQHGKLRRNSHEPRRVYGMCCARFVVVVAVIVKTLPCDV